VKENTKGSRYENKTEKKVKGTRKEKRAEAKQIDERNKNLQKNSKGQWQ